MGRLKAASTLRTEHTVSTTITNYDGGITSTPQQHVHPKSVAELQEILRDRQKYPGPVRAMGSNHSLTPCAVSTGTVVSMDGFTKIVKIDAAKKTFTAQAGLQLVDAAAALRKKDLQFMLNIEIGNITLGSAACCQTKDALDGVELGQVNSYVTAIKWVSPSGELMEASETKNPELLPYIRASYGLAGIVYEVTFKIKPLEIISFDYDVHDVEDLKDSTIKKAISSNQSIVLWTIGDDIVIQSRNKARKLKHEWLADAREFGWNFLGAYTGRGLRDRFGRHTASARSRSGSDTGVELAFYRLLSAGGGFTLEGPDKTINYSKTPQSARYAFTFWAFPRANYVKNMQGLREVGRRTTTSRQDSAATCRSARTSSGRTGARCCRTPGTATSSRSIRFTRRASKDREAWPTFLKAFNEWAHQRGGVPLLNQSPFVKKEHVVAAYGDRWKKLGDWLRVVDPDRRMVNEFFSELL